MRLIKCTEQLFERFNSIKMISRMTFTKEQLADMLYTIDCFNGLGEDEYRIGNYVDADYNILGGLAFMVLPSAVKRDVGNRLCLDQRRHEVYEDSQYHFMTPTEFRDMQDKITALFKKSSADLKKISELREPKDLQSVYSSHVADGACHYEGVNFWPWVRNPNLTDMKKAYYNFTEAEIIEAYIRDELKSKMI